MNFNAGDKAEITIGKNAVFSGNSAGKTGGAVANWGGSMRLGEGASFAENRAATDGGAVYNANYGGKNAEMTIAGVSVFENNEATGLGGAVYNDGKLLAVAEKHNVHDFRNGFGIAHAGAARCNKRHVLPAFACEERYAAQFKHGQNVRVAHFIQQRKPDNIEFTQR